MNSFALFAPGDRVVNDLKRRGRIVRIRDDAYERGCRRKDPEHGYYYHVEYDDGKFDTYVPGTCMRLMDETGAGV